MKKLAFILTLITVFILSCEKDDNPNNDNNTNNIVDLEVEVSHTDVTNFGGDDGTITVTIKSGNPPYEFIIDGQTKNTSSNDSFTFTSLTADDYKVEVKDSEDKTFSKDITIAEPSETFDELVIDVAVVHNEFDNTSGVIEITVTGGKEPYLFKLNDGDFVSDGTFDNLGGGIYSVTVKDDRDVELTEDDIEVNFGFDINVDVVHSNTHTDDGGVVTILPNVTNAGNSPYTFSIDGENWVDNNVFENISVPAYSTLELTVYAKDKFDLVREKDVVIENHYSGYRIGDEYNDGGYVGVVFEVIGDVVRIADIQNNGINMSYGQYENAFLSQINTGGLNWGTIDIETLESYLNVAKDFIDDGNVFNVEVGYSSRYWSTTPVIDGSIQRWVYFIDIKNGNYVLEKRYYTTHLTYMHMRGRYWATRPNSRK